MPLNESDIQSTIDGDGFSVIKGNDASDVLYEVVDIDPSAVDGGSYVNALGQTISGWGSESVDAYKSSVGGNNVKVLGLPLLFGPMDDPSQRVFHDTFEGDMPIVFITPGKPRVNKKLFGTSETGGLFNLGSTVNNVLNATANEAFSMIGLNNNKDGRFISLKPAYSDYYKYVQTLLQYVHASMGLEGFFDFSKYSDVKDNYGLAFYTTKGTYISESSNNSYMMSETAREANSKQSALREQKMLASTGASGVLDQMSNWLKDTVVGITENIPILGGIVGALTENLDGSQLVYPDLWDNSTFDRSYSLEFKFYSPYGDPQSIFNYVYVPFISLVALGLPLQDSYYSYKQPFIVRMSSPGRFECECGVIINMNIVRGNEQTWTAEGLPREITVTMSVRDLYPSLTLSKTANQLKYNTGLTSFIECMAGIRYDQLNFLKRAGTNLKVKGNRLQQILSFKGLENKVSDFKYSTSQKMIDFLR